jgi:signal transduction histidine kinase
MPGEAGRNTESGGLFAAPVSRELQRRGCRGVHVIEGMAPVEAHWATAPVGPHGSAAYGWRFGLAGADGQPASSVLLEFADRDALDEAARAALAAILGASAAFAGTAPPCGSCALVDRSSLSRHLHDLRNALNSLLMNAAVLAAKLPPAERENRFARQVQVDGERCAALLQALSDATRPADDVQ